ncbi:hypothetical protein INT43_006527 [Umbelopsis isabellina]|uniref:Uncharacterized protein n=1 Tax=Mortierella isabellina TaxID=91625 RepID=A0A8H7Q0G2_MORIS|nr:hypothetical protein INT43_006527 [Umbelopsis isabellina]
MEQHPHNLQGVDMDEFMRQFAISAYVQHQQQLAAQQGGTVPPPAYNSAEMTASTVAASTPIATAAYSAPASSSFWSPRQPRTKKVKAAKVGNAAVVKKAKVPSRVVSKPSTSNPRGHEGQSVGDFRCNIM